MPRIFLIAVVFMCCAIGYSQTDFAYKTIERVEIIFERGNAPSTQKDELALIATREVGGVYSKVNVRNAIAKIYDTGSVVSVRVEAENVGQNGVSLEFKIKRKSLAKRITLNVNNGIGSTITEQDLLLRLNLLRPGTSISERDLDENSNVILTYLRERGFYNAEVLHRQISLNDGVEVEVVFDVSPNIQAKIGALVIEIGNFDDAKVRESLGLSQGANFSQEKLADDIAKIQAALRAEDRLAPYLDEPSIIYDSAANTIDVAIRGSSGAKIKFSIDSEKEKIGRKLEDRLLPIKREGTIDYSAIIEGKRRLENYFQERGYFFASVAPRCSVTPAFNPGEASETKNDSEELCAALTGAKLSNREIEIRYDVELNRRLKLVDIRLTGTDKFDIAEIRGLLESQTANILGVIPFFGYGRGYTSIDHLKRDRETIKSLLRELGYRKSEVGVKQGVSIEGENLIVTFAVTEGLPTVVEGVEINGNSSFSDDELLKHIPNLEGKNFSRSAARNGVKKLAEFYAAQGFFDAKVSYSTTETIGSADAQGGKIKIAYNIENEGKEVLVNRILINGNGATLQTSILKTINILPGAKLRLADIFSSEQNLYATDNFERVEIITNPAGETLDSKSRLADVLINLEEKKPRLITYGGGYSTDLGLSGFFDIRHFNLFNRLYQGGAQIRWSQRQQLVQVNFLNPRMLPDGKDEDGRKRYAPVTFTAQYQRDSTVTRFFRSTFDSGTFGIVQRIDENGIPVDEFGIAAGDPTINRFTLSAETNRTISKKNRSILFVKYRFEDVRLFNFESLLVKELLRPDAKIRISGFGATFVRDTRRNCSIRNSLLEIIARGEPGDPCRYNPGDPTTGDYLTAEYNISLPAIGANIGFNKLHISYNRFYTPPKLKNTVLAGRAVFGISNVFSNGDRFSAVDFPGLDGSLPISERFFAGGSTTIRGFDFEEAGPRIVVFPEGEFRNQQGEIVNLNPFTIPFGGNAVAIVNLEARIPVSENVRVVPFYDGGNVFTRASQIFKRDDTAAGTIFEKNLRASWTNTVGLGFRIKTPIGGEFALDYGYLLNPPKFVISQPPAPDGVYRLHQGQIHFRFSQAF